MKNLREISARSSNHSFNNMRNKEAIPDSQVYSDMQKKSENYRKKTFYEGIADQNRKLAKRLAQQYLSLLNLL
jgi:hypothetical protein